MLIGLLILFGFQGLGWLLVTTFNLPIPATVAGLILLFSALILRGQVAEGLTKITTFLLPLLPLFLIPASAGIIQYSDTLKREYFPILIALSVSLVLSFALIPFVFLFFMRLFGKR